MKISSKFLTSNSIKDFVKINLKNKKDIKLISWNRKNPYKFKPNSFWGDNSKLKK